MEDGNLPMSKFDRRCYGLCESFHTLGFGPAVYDDVNLFEPLDYWRNNFIPPCWGGEVGRFTKLRQNVVLFLAAIHNENFNDL
jgi:hypothetical protein